MSNSFVDAPSISQDHLVEWAGWTLLRQGKALSNDNGIDSLNWNAPILNGSVLENDSIYKVELNLKSLTFVQVKCSCSLAGGSRFCKHAVALAYSFKEKIYSDFDELSAEDSCHEHLNEATNRSELTELKSFKRGEGELLELICILPPNFEQSIKRNMVLIKIELAINGNRLAPERISTHQTFIFSEKIEKATRLLESWSSGKLCSILQLKASQFRELLEIGENEILIFDSMTAENAMTVEELDTKVYPLLFVSDPPQNDKIELRRSRPVNRKARKSAVESLPPESWLRIDGSNHFLSIQINSRDDPQYEPLKALLKNYAFRVEPSNGKWWLRDQHKVLNFLAKEREHFDQRFSPAYTDNFKSRTKNIRTLNLKTSIQEMGSGYKLEISLGEDGVDDVDIRQAISSGFNYIIKNGIIWLLDENILNRFNKAKEELTAKKGQFFTPQFELKLNRSELINAEQILSDTEFEYQAPVSWQKCSRALEQFGNLEKPPVGDKLFEQLRSYQKIGTAWLFHLYNNSLGGVLADEMGLGKTVQSIGLLSAIKNTDKERISLIVSPVGLIRNWEREIQRFSPDLKVKVVHGSKRNPINSKDGNCDVVITSYSTLRNDLGHYIDLEFAVVIADEAQHIKNRKTQAAVALRQLNAEARFVLTGTPIENSIDDLRSLFEFCLPGYLKRREDVIKKEDKKWLDQRMLSKASHYILRRNKKSVAPELPDKIEQVIWCDFDEKQAELYRQVREKIQQKMDQLIYAGAQESRVRFLILTELLRLRQVCADPKLLDENFKFEMSAKMIAFKEILEEAIDGGHKILLFSQFVGVLTHLREYLDARKIFYSYIDGKTKNRPEVCDEFNENPDIPVCLISLKAGGTGLNLTGANIVVHFDPWWNPAVEDQATDRAHRIGQSKKVMVYKLVCTGTVEDKVLYLQKSKADLLREVLDESVAKTAKVNLDTLKDLIQDKA